MPKIRNKIRFKGFFYLRTDCSPPQRSVFYLICKISKILPFSGIQKNHATPWILRRDQIVLIICFWNGISNEDGKTYCLKYQNSSKIKCIISRELIKVRKSDFLLEHYSAKIRGEVLMVQFCHLLSDEVPLVNWRHVAKYVFHSLANRS